MSQDKNINIKNSRKGTIITYFSTALSGNTSDIYPAYIKKDNPDLIFPYNGNIPIERTSNNNFKEDKSGGFVIGNAYKETTSQVLKTTKKEKIKNRFVSKMKQTNNNAESWVSFKDTFIDDYYADIKLTRTFNTLDTLSIKNNLLSTWSTQQAETGVVFGKLVARQKILDENGEKVLIPLRNVPVGIFNSSDEFPEITSVDNDSNRIKLNLKENTKNTDYFNVESFNTDEEFLSKDSSPDIPEKFKYTTITDDNGEFVLTDIPVGEQVFMLEVDLLKQGLTHDEVALNFFPYPSDDEPNIGNVPHFFFRQIPISVVSSWGDFQTGYTELNITVNLDLRKWATYYHPPVSAFEKTYEQNITKGINNAITVEIRNMATEDYSPTVEVVQVNENLNRVAGQQLEWTSEFLQKTNKLQFRKHDMLIFKTPANIYDPEGFKTDKDGNQMLTQKGVWLAGYQFKIYYVDTNVFRTTGFEWVWYSDFNTNSGLVGRDHFHLNRNILYDIHDIQGKKVQDNKTENGIGKYPYEKPWNHLYPEKYKIPKKPIVQNPSWVEEVITRKDANVYLNKPKYLDGDLVGYVPYDKDSGGYGLQDFDGTYISNRHSETATKDYMYKYESGVSFQERYANGYRPNCTSCDENKQFGNLSKVINGEKYQRVECGYGYYLRPWGWPRVGFNEWGDTLLKSDIEFANGFRTNTTGEYFVDVGNNYYSYPLSIEKFVKDDLSLKLDTSAKFQIAGIDIYRIIDPSPSNLVEPSNPILETFAFFNFQKFYYQRGRKPGTRVKTGVREENVGGDDEMFSTRSDIKSVYKTVNDYIKMTITNLGEMDIENFEGKQLPVGTPVEFTSEFTSQLKNESVLNLKLPGNDAYNLDENVFKKAKYSFSFTNIVLHESDTNGNIEGRATDIIINVDNEVGKNDAIPTYYLVSECKEMRTQYFSPEVKSFGTVWESEGCKYDWKIIPIILSVPVPIVYDSNSVHKVKINGLTFINNDNNKGSALTNAYFQNTGISVKCSSLTMSSNVTSIPIEII